MADQKDVVMKYNLFVGQVGQAEFEAEENNEQFIDDVTGDSLNANGVRTAMEKEIAFLRDMQVYEKMTREQAIKQGARQFIQARWVDVLKASGEHRSRLVAKELARTARADLFSPTQSLEAFKIILSLLEGHGRRPPTSHRLLVVDVSRAFFSTRLSSGTCLWSSPMRTKRANTPLGR